MVESRDTFAEKEVTSFLVQDGYVVGTPQFAKELLRRYEPVEGERGRYYERYNWTGDRLKCPTS